MNVKKTIIGFCVFITQILYSQTTLCFTPSINSPQTTTNYISSINLADLNNDGNLDYIATQTFPHFLNIKYGTGNGTFTNSIQYIAANEPVESTINDFNNDGKLDVIVATGNGAKLSIYTATTMGFNAYTSYTLGARPFDICSADFNNDGNKDVAILTHTNLIIVNGNGNGTFQTATSYSFATTVGGTYGGIFAKDMNNDSKTDIILGNELYPFVKLFYNNGVGVFTSSITYTLPTGIKPADIAVADLNSDGNNDIAISGNNGTQPTRILFLNATNSVISTYTTGINSYGIKTADFNNDSKQDLITFDVGATYVLLNNNSFTPTTFSLNSIYGTTFNIGDINNDTKIDIVEFTNSSTQVINNYLQVNCSTTNLNKLNNYRDLNIFPNPSTGIFMLNNENQTEIIITDILGQSILTQTLQQGKNQINIGEQPSGIYFIKTNNQTFKIVKQ